MNDNLLGEDGENVFAARLEELGEEEGGEDLLSRTGHEEDVHEQIRPRLVAMTQTMIKLDLALFEGCHNRVSSTGRTLRARRIS